MNNTLNLPFFGCGIDVELNMWCYPMKRMIAGVNLYEEASKVL